MTVKKLLRLRRGGGGKEIKSEDGITWKKSRELLDALITNAGHDKDLKAKLEAIRGEDRLSNGGYLSNEGKNALSAILYAPSSPSQPGTSQQQKAPRSGDDGAAVAPRRHSQRLSEAGSEGGSPALL